MYDYVELKAEGNSQRMKTDLELELLIERYQLHVSEEDYQRWAAEHPVREYSAEEVKLFTCVGCGVNTLEINEYYMVQFHIWQAVIPKHYQREVLCIGCLEGYLGRELVTKDFIEAPINYRGPRSQRLQQRMGDWFIAPLYDPEKESLWEATRRLAGERGW
jgi:hypothetical protein